jgi:hypothetical protein
MQLSVEKQQSNLNSQIGRVREKLSAATVRNEIPLLQNLNQANPLRIGGVDWDNQWDNWSNSK